jgi:hypothetical protein
MENLEPTKKKLCKQPLPKKRTFEPGISAHRMGYILSGGLKWVNGTVITYFFLEGDAAQHRVVRKGFETWKAVGVGVSFKETTDGREAMVRIGFDHSDGSWSYVGREILSVPFGERTMNFGWDLTANSYGLTTAVHEIGHTLGFQHEHQSPFAGIEWNKKAVYAEFSGPPNNWPKEQIDINILDKLPANQVQGSAWDPDSIMEYEFGPGLVARPLAFVNGIYPPGTLSAKDIAGVRSFYPVRRAEVKNALQLGERLLVKAASGEQDEFVFTAPYTRKYCFQTAGSLDTVLVVSEMGETENYYLSGDDDSGFDKNSKVTLPLVKGRRYLVQLRVLYAPEGKEGTMMVTEGDSK